MTLAELTQTHDNPIDAAKAYASLGWAVFPVVGKRPTTPNGLKDASSDFKQIETWWTNQPDAGVAIATGTTSGVWVLDIDVTENKDGPETLRAMTAHHGALPRTAKAVSGGGGVHFYFVSDPAWTITNGSATAIRDVWGPGIDIRGDGGYIIAPPSPHPAGTRYYWNRTPWDIEPAAAPQWLYQATIAPADDSAPQVTSNAGVVIDLPIPLNRRDHIAEWKASVDFRAMLIDAGWIEHSTRGNDLYLTRPGKARRDGHSAILHDNQVLVVFTTELDPGIEAAGTRTSDGSGVKFNAFDWLCATTYAGDRSAAFEAIRGLTQPHRRPSVAAQPTVALTSPEADEVALFADLTDWWDNPQPRKTADLLTRTDGAGLLYQDQLNWIHGDSGSGKTWVGLHAAAQLVAAGQHVAWIHYEDPNPGVLVSRLKQLGVDREAFLEHFHYIDPAGEPLDTARIISECLALNVAHVVLDSVGEALNASSINEDADAEVGPWITYGPRQFVNHGIGFTGIDHGTKNGANKLHPSGSKRKRAAITGAGILVEAVVAPTITTDGHLRIICAKDRHGNHPQSHVTGFAHLRHNIITGTSTMTVEPGPPQALDQDAENADRLLRAVVRIVEGDPGIVKREAVRLMPMAGNAKRIAAIDEAISSGLISVKHGTRNAQYLHPAPGGDRRDGHSDG